MAKLSLALTVWWAVFPDVLAFGPAVALGIWLRIRGTLDGSVTHSGFLPHVHVGLPLYPFGHSLLVFFIVFGICTVLARKIVWETLGWPLHILIDIPTHSFSYYATRFLWPLSDFRIDGIAWWTGWFWISTYAALLIVYVLIWRTGWLFVPHGGETPPPNPAEELRTSRRDSLIRRSTGAG